MGSKQSLLAKKSYVRDKMVPANILRPTSNSAGKVGEEVALFESDAYEKNNDTVVPEVKCSETVISNAKSNDSLQSKESVAKVNSKKSVTKGNSKQSVVEANRKESIVKTSSKESEIQTGSKESVMDARSKESVVKATSKESQVTQVKFSGDR